MLGRAVRRVAGEQGEGAAGLALRQRQAHGGGTGDGRGDAGHDVDRDPGLLQRLDLLDGTAEDERVAALQADDAVTRLGLLDHE